MWARPILTGLAHPFFFRYILLHILPPPGLRRSRSSMASPSPPSFLRPPASLLPCSPPHGSGLAPVRRAHSYSSPPPTGLAPALLLLQLTIETTCVAGGLAGLAILTVTELEARPQERRPRRPRRRSSRFSISSARRGRDATSPVVARAREAAAQRMLPRTRPARAASQKLQRRARIAARSGRAVLRVRASFEG